MSRFKCVTHSQQKWLLRIGWFLDFIRPPAKRHALDSVHTRKDETSAIFDALREPSTIHSNKYHPMLVCNEGVCVSYCSVVVVENSL